MDDLKSQDLESRDWERLEMCIRDSSKGCQGNEPPGGIG